MKHLAERGTDSLQNSRNRRKVVKYSSVFVTSQVVKNADLGKVVKCVVWSNILKIRSTFAGKTKSRQKLQKQNIYAFLDSRMKMTGSAYNRGGISMEAFLWHPLSITCQEGGTYACSVEEPAHQHLQEPTLLLPPRLRRQNENPNTLLVCTLAFWVVLYNANSNSFVCMIRTF